MDMIAVFRPEANELLEDLEAALLKLEADPTHSEGIGRVFRVIHTLKGSAGMAGFMEIVRFTHDVETVFDRIRKGTLPLSEELLTLALQTKDHLQLLLRTDPNGTTEVIEKSNHLLAQFSQIINPDKAVSAPPSLIPPATDNPNGQATWWIRYQPAPTSILTNPLGLLNELNALGTMVHLFHLEEMPTLQKYATDNILCWWDILLNMESSGQEIERIFLFKEDADKLLIHPIAKGSIRASDLQELHNSLRQLKEIKDDQKALHTLQATNRIHEEKRALRKKSAPQTTPPVATEADTSSIRVDSMQLNSLVDMMGELVILQSRMTMAANQIGHTMLTQIAEDFERMTAVMRKNALALRMMPIGTSFGTLRRLVRDMTLSLNKEINLVTEGEQTKLDKTVLDRLKDPLMHILRNAMDHGIEMPTDRATAGKPTTGTIRLSATTASGEVFVTISDDGRGIDPRRIRQKAVEKGLLAADQELNDKELIHLIFEPGFSTAERVSDISGRGVGMDVVKKRIDDLRGSVEIKSSVGKGSTFTIRLPLTLAIIDGMMVQIGSETFVIPLASIKACQERNTCEESSNVEVDSIERMGHLIPCLNLRRILKVSSPPPEYERIIIVQADGMTVGLAVDVVIGRQQAVIKRLGKVYKSSTWISGTSINGDGSISLILDVLQLVRYAASQTHNSQVA